MAESNADPIPKELAEAFAHAVLGFELWHPQHEGQQISISGRGYHSIDAVCGLVDKFTDPLPKHVLEKLRSYMHDQPHGDLIAELLKCPTYATGAVCLRRLATIDLRHGAVEAGQP
jgi:hypothetical protein